MSDFLLNSNYLLVVITLVVYISANHLKSKFKSALLNPLLITCIVVIIYLVLTGTDYNIYQKNMNFITYFLTPATVCLAIPLYRRFESLKKNAPAIIIGCIFGVITTFVFILILAILFDLSHTYYVTLLPKSVTTAVGIVLSQEMKGITSVTAASIVITGIFGNITAPFVCKLFKINNPTAIGVGIGASSHVVGTAKAIEMGEVEGAMSIVSTVVSAILTSMSISFVMNLH